MPTESTAAPHPIRVAACDGDGGARIEHRPAPRPGPGEVVLRLEGCGLCGTDLFKLRHGVAPGTVLGHELVGRVAALGAGVEGFADGDRLVVPHHVSCGECALCRAGSETLCPVFRQDLLDPGGFAELVRLRPRAVRHAARRVPEALASEAAVFLEPAACVLRGIDRSGLAGAATGGGQDARAVVLGAGSMGLLHLLVLRALWPELPVTVVDPMPERRALAGRLGGIATTPEEAAAAIAERDGVAGADAVFDTVGGAARLAAAFELTREGGTVVLFAHAGPKEIAGFDLNRFFKSERRLVATYSGSLREQQRVFELLSSGRLDPSVLLSHRLPLSRFNEAVELTESRRALKVLLVPDDD